MKHQETWPLALSTWSVHRAIGTSFPDTPEQEGEGFSAPTWGQGSMSLMAVPERSMALGIGRLEICSFHINARDTGFIAELRAAIAGSGITFQTLLIDDGDITHPAEGDRDEAWVGRWIDIAAALGAEKARVIAGKQAPSPRVLDRSVEALAALSRRGAEQGVRVITENWHATMAGPAEVRTVMDRLGGTVGFLADFANWDGALRFDDLESILPRSENCHLHGVFDPNLTMDTDDFDKCLTAARRSGYRGPLTLIYSGPNRDEWAAVEAARDRVRAVESAIAP